jgi:hypothetical protein
MSFWLRFHGARDNILETDSYVCQRLLVYHWACYADCTHFLYCLPCLLQRLCLSFSRPPAVGVLPGLSVPLTPQRWATLGDVSAEALLVTAARQIFQPLWRISRKGLAGGRAASFSILGGHVGPVGVGGVIGHPYGWKAWIQWSAAWGS